SGKSIDKGILDQIVQTVPGLLDEAELVFNCLRIQTTTINYPSALEPIFSMENKPIMFSWMQYHPQDHIAELTIPTLIINGTKDLQVPVEEAPLLKDASKKGSLLLLEDMNHVMFPIEGDDLENSKSYNESFRHLSPELVPAILEFIK